MPSMTSLRRAVLSGPLLFALLLVLSSIQAGAAQAATRTQTAPAIVQASHATAGPLNPQAEQLRQMVRDSRLASTVHVLNSLAPTTIEQFPLVPSGISSDT